MPSVAFAILIGVATTYGGPYVGQPLYCADAEGPHYDGETPRWVAVDVGEYESGHIKCGDELWITFSDGARMKVLALDAGTLAGYTTILGGPIVVDVPEIHAPFVGLDWVRVVNRSAAGRVLERIAGQ